MNSSFENEIVYQLVFQGPRDGEESTLRNLKGALIGELQVDVERAKFLLEHAPITIEESSEENSLVPQLNALKKAGADALIVRSEKMRKREIERPPAPLKLIHTSDEPAIDEIPGDLDLFIDPTPEEVATPSALEDDENYKLREDPQPLIQEEEDPGSPQVRALVNSLQRSALLDDDQTPLSRPLSEIGKRSAPQQTETGWNQYRTWVNEKDSKFRVLLNEEMIVGTIISCVATILVCLVLIPLELHTRRLQWNHELKVDSFVDTYADVLLYGRLPDHKEKK